MRQFRGGQPSRNLRTRLWLRGDTPPAPPSQGGDDAQRNPDEDKACARRTFHHPRATQAGTAPVSEDGDFTHWYGENGLDDGDPAPAQPARRARPVGLVWPGWRVARGGDESRLQDHSKPPNVLDEPAFHLDGAAVQPAALFRNRVVLGAGDEVLASSSEVGSSHDWSVSWRSCPCSS